MWRREIKQREIEEGRNNYSLRRGEVGLGFIASAMVAANPSESFQRKTIFSATFMADEVERVYFSLSNGQAFSPFSL